eukprot:3994624-Pyramimonas_sp.AAC.1
MSAALLGPANEPTARPGGARDAHRSRAATIVLVLPVPGGPCTRSIMPSSDLARTVAWAGLR